MASKTSYPQQKFYDSAQQPGTSSSAGSSGATYQLPVLASQKATDSETKLTPGLSTALDFTEPPSHTSSGQTRSSSSESSSYQGCFSFEIGASVTVCPQEVSCVGLSGSSVFVDAMTKSQCEGLKSELADKKAVSSLLESAVMCKHEAEQKLIEVQARGGAVIEHLTKQVEDCKQRLTSEGEKWEAKVQSLQEELVRKEKEHKIECDGLRQKISKMETEVERLRGELKCCQLEKNEEKLRRELAEARVGEAEAREGEAKAKLALSEDGKRKLEIENSRLRERYTSVKEELRRSLTHLSDVESITDFTEQFDSLTEQLDSFGSVDSQQPHSF